MKTKYTKEIIYEAVKKSTSISGVVRFFDISVTGASHRFFKKLIEKYEISTSHFVNTNKGIISSKKLHYSKILVKNRNSSKESSKTLRRALIEYGIEYKCNICNISCWQNKKIRLEIHHINENVFDNRIENLQLVCPNCHSQIHNKCGKKRHKAKYNCRFCNDKCYSKTKICRKCHIKELKKDIPSKQEIIDNFIKVKSFIGLGKIYNVTDNAVRKWCKFYNIPFRTKDFKKYILENT